MIKERQTYRVTGRHVSPTYDGKVYTMTLCQDDEGWFATADGLGCSKNYETPCTAIMAMMVDHGYTDVRLV